MGRLSAKRIMHDTSITWNWHYQPLTDYRYRGYHLLMNMDGQWYVSGDEERLYNTLDQILITIDGEIKILKKEIECIKAKRTRQRTEG